MLRLLVIAPYPFLPAESGGQQLIARFCAALAQRVRLWVVSAEGNDARLATGYTLEPLLGKGLSRYADLGLVTKLSAYVRQHQIDWMVIEHPYLGWLANAVRHKTGVPFLLHTHNVEHLRFRSLGKPWWPVLKWYERWTLRRAEVVTFLTQEDAEQLQALADLPAEKLLSLPYGIDRHQAPPPAERQVARNHVLERLQLPAETQLLFFCGSMDYGPNATAVDYLLNQFLPAYEAKADRSFALIICGRRLNVALALQAQAHPCVHYLGFVESLEPFLLGCDVFMNLVVDGGGIKTKLVEALAGGMVALSTQNGAAGIPERASSQSLQIVTLSDVESVAMAAPRANKLKPVSQDFYDHFFWPRIIDRLLEKMQQRNVITTG